MGRRGPDAAGGGGGGVAGFKVVGHNLVAGDEMLMEHSCSVESVGRNELGQGQEEENGGCVSQGSILGRWHQRTQARD